MTVDIIINLSIGIVSGVIASILTLIGDRWLHSIYQKKHLCSIAGEYIINTIVPPGKIDKEQVTITHIKGCHFSITAKNGPTGDWIGRFIISEEYSDVAHGTYHYPSTSDWGQHEMLIDRSTDSIYVYGINRSKPGCINPFSYSLVRRVPPTTKKEPISIL